MAKFHDTTIYNSKDIYLKIITSQHPKLMKKMNISRTEHDFHMKRKIDNS